LLRTFLKDDEEIFFHECDTLLGGIKSSAESDDNTLLLDIDRLIREKKITPEQGVSLITCSSSVLEIYRLLLKAAKYLVIIGSEYRQLEEVFFKEEEDINIQIKEAA
ncbi:MAG: hypothetical protein DRQ48_04965, partial [Gammaproteobacteria bacterium]